MAAAAAAPHRARASQARPPARGLPKGAGMDTTTVTAPGELARYARDLADTDPAAVTGAGEQLAAVITRDDWPDVEAAALAKALAEAMGQAGERGRARIALLLGILAEKDPDARSAAMGCLGTCLELLTAASCGNPEYLALLYLLAHFPEDRQQIMAVAGKHAAADPHGISRLERTLLSPDPADPATVNAAGRSWPSPAFLAVTDAEIEAAAAVRSAQPAAQIVASWEADTDALLAYAGGMALAGGA